MGHCIAKNHGNSVLLYERAVLCTNGHLHMHKYFEFGTIRPLHYFFGVSALLGLLFSLTSSSDQEYFAMHVLLWLSQTTGPIIILVYGHIFLHNFSWFDLNNPWLKLFISGLFGSLLFSPFALGLDLLWGNDPFPKTSAELQYLWFDELSGVMPPITLSWIIINAPWLLSFGLMSPKDSTNPVSNQAQTINVRNDVNTQAKSTSGNNANELPFILLTNSGLGTDIIYLKSELHYLRVVTTKGKELILYNLRDAVSEIPTEQGNQPHRSYWVNYTHVANMRIHSRQGTLLMSNGEEVPVSRSKIELFERFTSKVSNL